MGKKVLYVSDNRNRVNWGCRGTSISLYQTLSTNYEMKNIIYGDDVRGPLSKNNLLSKNSRFISFLFYAARKNYVFKRLKESSYYDFIQHDPSKSLQTFLKNLHNNDKFLEIYYKIKNSDIVIINGEGDAIFTTPPRRQYLFLLFMIELSTYLRKNVYYVNGVISDCPSTGRNLETYNYSKITLSKCKRVLVRDPVSLEMVKEMSKEINCEYIPDSLFTWRKYFYDVSLPSNGDFIIPHPEDDFLFNNLNFNLPYICIGGSSSAAWKPQEAIPQYINLVKRVKELGLNIYLVQTCSGDSFLKNVSEATTTPLIPVNVPILSGGLILAKSKLFISGRYHPSIFASLGGTPCIFLGSNSHKTKSLQKVLEYKEIEEFSAIPSEEECNAIIERAKSILVNEKEIRENIKKVVEKREEEAKKIVNIIECIDTK
ncbi:polysaccharide pyruvyl transferase family protein [Methanosarcina sp. UBA411]|jgi:polysaccharide pyruvyl transferase WcaK-like protein|uniref:polysaccharide pyruvyl transferase family protein n=1 Tax=Methanosarcina sp. UBA411 TaxID=1915589 RepID=UPI0025DD2BCB|nr:polysaccharide pyruvyl transferase family protein [Methanosarcina sp. UBA411]